MAPDLWIPTVANPGLYARYKLRFILEHKYTLKGCVIIKWYIFNL